MHTDRCGNTRRQKCCAKGSGKEVKIQEFMYRDHFGPEVDSASTRNDCQEHFLGVKAAGT